MRSTESITVPTVAASSKTGIITESNGSFTFRRVATIATSLKATLKWRCRRKHCGSSRSSRRFQVFGSCVHWICLPAKKEVKSCVRSRSAPLRTKPRSKKNLNCSLRVEIRGAFVDQVAPILEYQRSHRRRRTSEKMKTMISPSSIWLQRDSTISSGSKKLRADPPKRSLVVVDCLSADQLKI